MQVFTIEDNISTLVYFNNYWVLGLRVKNPLKNWQDDIL